jgi:hypothetical protein
MFCIHGKLLRGLNRRYRSTDPVHQVSLLECFIYSGLVELAMDDAASREYSKSPIMIGSDVRPPTTVQLSSAGIDTTPRVTAVNGSCTAGIETHADEVLGLHNQRKSFAASEVVNNVFGGISPCQHTPVAADGSSYCQSDTHSSLEQLPETNGRNSLGRLRCQRSPILSNEVDSSLQNQSGHRSSPGEPHEADRRRSQGPLWYESNPIISTEVGVDSLQCQSQCKRSLLQPDEANCRSSRCQRSHTERVEGNGCSRPRPGLQHGSMRSSEMGCESSQYHGSPIEATGIFGDIVYVLT